MDVRPTPNILWRLFALTGIGTMTWLSVDDRAWEQFSDATGDAVPRQTIRGAVVVTIGLHLLEAIFAGSRARRSGLEHPGRWARSALLYGFPVLRRLGKARRGAVAVTADELPVAA